MEEIDEMKLRTVFYYCIMDFFMDNLPPELFSEDRYKSISYDLTEELIKAYEDYRKIQ